MKFIIATCLALVVSLAWAQNRPGSNNKRPPTKTEVSKGGLRFYNGTEKVWRDMKRAGVTDLGLELMILAYDKIKECEGAEPKDLVSIFDLSQHLMAKEAMYLLSHQHDKECDVESEKRKNIHQEAVKCYLSAELKGKIKEFVAKGEKAVLYIELTTTEAKPGDSKAALELLKELVAD